MITDLLRKMGTDLSAEQSKKIDDAENKQNKDYFNLGIQEKTDNEMIPVREVVKYLINQNPTYSNTIVHKTVLENSDGEEKILSAKVRTISMKAVATYLKGVAIIEEVIFEPSAGPQSPALFPRAWSMVKGQEYLDSLMEE